jgi:hypothetical protein
MTDRPRGVTRLTYLLWAAAILAAALLVISWNTAARQRFDYMLAAELLLVFVLAVEGLVAIYELRDARERARFEALLSIYNFSREIHTIAFDKPELWSVIGINEEADLQRRKVKRYAQLFCNLNYLEFEACNLHHIDDDQWEKDARDAILRPEMKKFLLEHEKYYPKDFVAWFKGVFEKYPEAS